MARNPVLMGWRQHVRPQPGVAQGAGTVGFDCSGLAMYAWNKAGVRLDHWTGTQWTSGPHVPISALRPGDLIFFATDPSNPATIHHVGIYIGDGRMVEAPLRGPGCAYRASTGVTDRRHPSLGMNLRKDRTAAWTARTLPHGVPYGRAHRESSRVAGRRGADQRRPRLPTPARPWPGVAPAWRGRSAGPDGAQWPPWSAARLRERSISSSASTRPTQLAPSTDLPGSRSL